MNYIWTTYELHGRNRSDETAMSSERMRSFPTTLLGSIAAKVKRSGMFGIRMNNGILLMVSGMTRIAPWGDSGEERGCTLPLGLDPQGQQGLCRAAASVAS